MGKPLWTRVFAKANREVDYHQGSRGSVTVDDDLLYALGVSGDLVCVNVKDGTPVWSKLLIKEFGGTLPFYRESYGYAESPLIHGNLVLVTPGGTENTIVALDKRNGSLVWRASVPDRYKGASRAAYSSIVAGKFPDGVQFVQFLQGGLVGITLQGQLACAGTNLPTTLPIAPLPSSSTISSSPPPATAKGVVWPASKRDRR